MKTRITLNRRELAQIAAIVEKYGPEQVTLICEGGNGIGTFLTLEFDAQPVLGMKAKTVITISDEENW